jgi:hypothetical protein
MELTLIGCGTLSWHQSSNARPPKPTFHSLHSFHSFYSFHSPLYNAR